MNKQINVHYNQELQDFPDEFSRYPYPSTPPSQIFLEKYNAGFNLIMAAYRNMRELKKLSFEVDLSGVLLMDKDLVAPHQVLNPIIELLTRMFRRNMRINLYYSTTPLTPEPLTLEDISSMYNTWFDSFRIRVDTLELRDEVY